MTRSIATTDVRGGACSTVFNGRSDIADFETATIQRIVVESDLVVYSLTVYYTGQTRGAKHGKTGGTTAEVALEVDEYIKVITGWSDDSSYYVGHLSFISNKGRRWGPFGKNTPGSFFVWNGGELISGGVLPPMGLLYFSSSYGGSLGHLQATFATYSGSDKPPQKITYEPTEGRTGSDTGVVLSKFARNLISSVVTLIVGEERIPFHVSESILCQLSFFRAALKGEFKEASTKIIEMPDDEPDTVSALLEYLSIGTYTYTYDSAKSETVSADLIPARNLAEGLFHIRLYTLASKYDHQPLVRVAWSGFVYVLKGLTELESNMDVISLLGDMYDRGQVIAHWADDADLEEIKRRLPKVLKQLFGTHSHEMDKALSDCPALAVDLVRLLALS